MRPPVRSKSVGTKVSELQFATLMQRANAQNLTISEWARDVLLSATEANINPAITVLLAELIATRTILINLNYAIANSESLDADALRNLLAKADSAKMQRAEVLLKAALLSPNTNAQSAETRSNDGQ